MFKEFYRHVQDEVKTIANNLNEENFSLSKQMIEERLQLLELLNSIHPLPTANNKSIDDVDESQLTPDPEPVSNHERDDKDPLSPQEETSVSNLYNLYEFKRNASSGLLYSTINKGANPIYIPETIIRDMNIATGDIIKADPASYEGRYNYSLYEKVNLDGIEPDRVEIKFGVVDDEDGQLVVKRTTNGEIYMDGEKASITVHEGLKEKYGLVEGSIVDLAYLKTEKRLQIAWHHKTHQEFTYSQSDNQSSFAAALGSALKNNKKNNDSSKSSSDPFEGKLKNKTVTIMGATETQDNIKRVFAAADIEHQSLRGDESEVRITAAIRKSDAFIVIPPFTEKHSGSHHAIKVCKDLGVPYEQTTSYGVSNITNLLKEMIN
ncbi:hypothetical protein [Bacillus pumilus]|uniref:hypothetical protein n=1 Tax=Bacillus pumilus TaxID=1408 RepID=UPI0011A9D2A1|nr:hypothetical protein [Bacillus pumilus]